MVAERGRQELLEAKDLRGAGPWGGWPGWLPFGRPPTPRQALGSAVDRLQRGAFERLHEIMLKLCSPPGPLPDIDHCLLR